MADELRAAHLVAACRARGLRLATAESLTGGLVAATVVEVPGASDVLVGGVVAYDARVKVELLGVDPGLVGRVGTVDEAVAVAMAEGVASRLRADVAVATTGVAGPGPSEGKPAGTAWIACTVRGVTTTRLLALAGNRDAVRRGCTEHALRLALHGVSRLTAAEGTVEHDPDDGPEETAR